jgi:hypothetical protein
VILIENERSEVLQSHSKLTAEEKAEEVVMLKRSSSSCVEIKKFSFWIGVKRRLRANC